MSLAKTAKTHKARERIDQVAVEVDLTSPVDLEVIAVEASVEVATTDQIVLIAVIDRKDQTAAAIADSVEETPTTVVIDHDSNQTIESKERMTSPVRKNSNWILTLMVGYN
jgi:capsular polysaccharide biosynthesis protein